MDQAITIAVDCGGTHIKTALMKEGRELDSSVIPNQNQAEDLNRVVETALGMLRKRGFSKENLLGMGLSLPGVVDYRRGRLVSINGKYEWGLDFDFLKWAQERFFDLPIVVENDARLALLGELTYGVGTGVRDAVLFMLGTGVGTSAVLEGMLLRGKHDQAGILGGHLSVDVRGFPCNCGNLGCVEGQVGSWRLPDYLKARPGFSDSSLTGEPKLDYLALSNAYRAGDSFAREAVGDIARLWGAGVVNLIHAYDPELVIFSGAVMLSADIFSPMIIEYVSKHAWTHWGPPQFAVAEDVTISALLGVEALLKEQLGLLRMVG